jgi:hypothetical protein
MAREIKGRASTSIDHLLRVAIAQKRLVTFTLMGLTRRAEPHDYGIVHGAARLFFYQVGGQSRSGPPRGWRWARVSDISNLEVLDETFTGTRPAISGRHVHWGPAHGLRVDSTAAARMIRPHGRSDTRRR